MKRLAKRRGKGRARVPKPTKRATDQPRLHAHRAAKALDKALEATTGQGLAGFTPTEDQLQLPVDERPLLAVHCDEGSTGYSACWHIVHSARSRMVIIRDIYHREWNDCKHAIMQAGLWWTTLLTRIPANMAYGPWGSTRWWRVAKAGARELQLKMTCQSHPCLRSSTRASVLSSAAPPPGPRST